MGIAITLQLPVERVLRSTPISNVVCRLVSRWRLYERIISIEVDGNPVTSGWSSGYSFLLPYAYMVSGIPTPRFG